MAINITIIIIIVTEYVVGLRRAVGGIFFFFGF